MPSAVILPPASLSAYIASVETLKRAELKAGNKCDFLFRGQSTDESLISRLARLKSKGELLNVENLMMAEFDRQLLPFTEFQPRDAWDLLALAQHHGPPTRLDRRTGEIGGPGSRLNFLTFRMTPGFS
jgi:hypothetical protein